MARFAIPGAASHEVRTDAPRRSSVRRRRGAARAVLFGGLVGVALYVLAPELAGLGHTWQRIRNGSPAWFAAAIAFEVASFAGYVGLLRRIVPRLKRADAWRITLAGVAATRIVTVAGAGGIAITIDGLRQIGLTARQAAERQAIDLAVLYGLFFGLMVLDGLFLLATGQHAAISAVPALVGAVVIALAFGVALVPATFERRLRQRLGGRGARVAAVPAVVAAGVRGALDLARRRDRALGAALAWWAFDVAAMWACVHAFGAAVSPPALLMAYLAGHAFNVLPVPGGIGPVEGGLIAALVAFGEPAGLALVAVLSYQLISVWLPAAPGAVALAWLRRDRRTNGGVG